jgi:hypothetical protein
LPALERENLTIAFLERIPFEGEITSILSMDHGPIFIFHRFSDLHPLDFNDPEYFASLERKEQSLTRKVLGRITRNIISVFDKQLDEINIPNTQKINFWNIAEYGIEGYNTMTDKELGLYKNYDKNGNVVGVALLGENNTYYKKLR